MQIKFLIDELSLMKSNKVKLRCRQIELVLTAFAFLSSLF